jgi:tmRNA-binding protein
MSNRTNTTPYQYTYSQPMSVTMPESLYAVVYSETAFAGLTLHPSHFHTIRDAQAFIDAYCRPYAQDAYITQVPVVAYSVQPK